MAVSIVIIVIQELVNVGHIDDLDPIGAVAHSVQQCGPLHQQVHHSCFNLGTDNPPGRGWQ